MTPGPQSIRDLDLRGQVTSVRGSVVDVSFPAGTLPDAGEAIVIEADPARELVAEVQQHLGPTVLRAVALENTAGLRSRRVAARINGGTRLQAVILDGYQGRPYRPCNSFLE